MIKIKELAEKLVCPYCGTKPKKVSIIDDMEIRPRVFFECPAKFSDCPVEEVMVEF